jgi:hypothetical protein
MKHRILVLLSAAVLTIVFAGSASAATQTQWQRLRTDVYTCTDGTACTSYIDPATDGSFAHWVAFPKNGDDSPLDANTSALVVHTPANDTSGNYDVAELWTRASLHLDKPAAQIKNLSFDAYKPALQGGSPRIDVFFENPLSDPAANGSTYVAIDATNCQQTLSSTWVRADATGQTALGCTIFGSNGATYSSDGTHSAWANLVAANPDAVVSFIFMVFDQPTGNTGINYRVDRISLGTNRMFTYSNTNAVSCNFSEGAC